MTEHIVAPLHGLLHLLLHHQLGCPIATTIATLLPLEFLTVLIVDRMGETEGGAQPGVGHVRGRTARVQFVRFCQLLVVR